MESDCEPIFKPWFKSIVRVCFVLAAGHAILTGHLSPVRITKNLADKKRAEVVDGRLLVNAGVVELQCPLLAYMPKNDVVDAALRKGVEILPNGDVICVLQTECPGFFNPVSYEERYVNLVALAIVTDTNCINACSTDDMKELMAIVCQMPAEDRFREMGSGGWRLGNTAWLDAITGVISKMPQAKCIQKPVNSVRLYGRESDGYVRNTSQSGEGSH